MFGLAPDLHWVAVHPAETHITPTNASNQCRVDRILTRCIADESYDSGDRDSERREDLRQFARIDSVARNSEQPGRDNGE